MWIRNTPVAVYTSYSCKWLYLKLKAMCIEVGLLLYGSGNLFFKKKDMNHLSQTLLQFNMLQHLITSFITLYQKWKRFILNFLYHWVGLYVDFRNSGITWLKLYVKSNHCYSLFFRHRFLLLLRWWFRNVYTIE